MSRGRIADIVAAAARGRLGDWGWGLCNTRLGLDQAMRMLQPIESKAVYVPGNAESADELRAETNAIVLHGESTDVADVTLFGIGYAIPVTPFGDWSCDLTEASATTMLDRMGKVDVLISHSPPKGVVDVGSNGASLGSTAVRAAIERAQPKLCFCGHIHDSWGQTGLIGATSVHNLGPTVNWFEV